MAEGIRFYLPPSTGKMRGRGTGIILPRTGPAEVLLGPCPRPCYDGAMRAFLCEVDHAGLRRLLPEEAILGDVSTLRMWARSARPMMTVVWALLADVDAEAIRVEVAADRPGDAGGLLLNRAVELLTLDAAAPDPIPRAC